MEKAAEHGGDSRQVKKMSEVEFIANAIDLFFTQCPVEEHEAFLQDVKRKFNITPRIRFSEDQQKYVIDFRYCHSEIMAFLKSEKPSELKPLYSFAD